MYVIANQLVFILLSAFVLGFMFWTILKFLKHEDNGWITSLISMLVFLTMIFAGSSQISETTSTFMLSEDQLEQFEFDPKTKTPDPLKESYDRAVLIDTTKVIYNQADGRKYLKNEFGKLVSVEKVIDQRKCRNCKIFKERVDTIWPRYTTIYLYKVYENGDSSIVYSSGEDKYLTSLITTNEK